jgi:hypothetical protein
MIDPVTQKGAASRNVKVGIETLVQFRRRRGWGKVSLDRPPSTQHARNDQLPLT